MLVLVWWRAGAGRAGRTSAHGGGRAATELGRCSPHMRPALAACTPHEPTCPLSCFDQIFLFHQLIKVQICTILPYFLVLQQLGRLLGIYHICFDVSLGSLNPSIKRPKVPSKVCSQPLLGGNFHVAPGLNTSKGLHSIPTCWNMPPTSSHSSNTDKSKLAKYLSLARNLKLHTIYVSSWWLICKYKQFW